MIKYGMNILGAIKNLFNKSKTEQDIIVNDVITFEVPKDNFEAQISRAFSKVYHSRKPRQHQIEALQALSKVNIGQVSIPTGTGKTYIQLMVHISDMIEKTNNNEVGVYVIAAHRLVLCKQLFNEFVYESSFVNDLDCDYLCVSSEPYSLKLLHSSMINFGVKKKDIALKFSHDDVEVKSTTVISEINKFVANSKKNNRHCVIIATYDSFDRLSGLPSIDVSTFDEAHEITRDDYFSNVDKIKPIIKKQFFFTATRKESDSKRGMNQSTFYGELIFEKSPREMIEIGEIVRPNNYHILNVKNDEGYDYDNPIMTIRSISEGFIEHKALVKKHSSSPKSIGAKLLVACDGADQLGKIIFDVNFRTWCTENNIRVFSVNSEHGEFCDFEKVNNRNTFMDKMLQMKDDEDAIFLHINILAEGIDLPSITGIMPIRDMDRTKLTQTLGRATRLIKEDRRRLYLEDTNPDKIYPHEHHKFIKPWAWIIIPNYLLDDSNQVRSIIDDVYNEYGTRAERFSETEKYMALSEFEMPSINTDDEMNRKFKDGELTHLFSYSELIKWKTEEMSDDKKLELFTKVLESYDA